MKRRSERGGRAEASETPDVFDGRGRRL